MGRILKAGIGVAAVVIIGPALLKPSSTPDGKPPAAAGTEQIKVAHVATPVPREPTPEEKAAAAAAAKKKAADEAIWQANVLSVSRLKQAMKNPDSFQLEQALRMDDGTVCLSYRAQNSFNAVVPARAVITKTEILTSDAGGNFTARWNARCANKTGTDITYIRRAIF